MSGGVVERLGELLLGMSEEEREALMASLAVQRVPRLPSTPAPSRELPEPRTRAVVTCQVEWT